MDQQELCNNFYSMNNVVTVKITMPPNDWEKLRLAVPHGGTCNFDFTGERYDWLIATSVEISGSLFPLQGSHSFVSVGISKKSWCGSIDDEKPCLKLNFSKNKPSNKSTMEGLLGTHFITLNNCKQDGSYIRQPLGYFLFNQAGLPHSRSNFAEVYVNDKKIGVYLNIEPVKDLHIQNNFGGNDKGNLYELAMPGHLTDDFHPRMTDLISFEGFTTYSDKSDLKLATQEISTNGLSGMAKVIDVEEFLKIFGMETLLKHWDGYTANLNNTLIYNDVTAVATPTLDNVKLKFIPWGIDQILQERPIQFGNGSFLGNLILNDANSLARLKAVIRNYIHTIFDQANYASVLSPYIDLMQNTLTGLGETGLAAQIDVVRDQVKLVKSDGFTAIGEHPLYAVNGNSIIQVDSSGNSSVFARGGNLAVPCALEFDTGGNLYVANYSGSIQGGSILKMDRSGTQSVFASGGYINLPDGLAFDTSGNLYVANAGNNTIIKVDSSGAQSVLTSGGNLNNPQALVFDTHGNLYVANLLGNNIIKVDGSGTQSVFASGKIFANPSGLAFDETSGILYVAQQDGNNILKVDSSGNTSVFASGGNLNFPLGLALDTTGSLFAASARNQTIVKVDSNGTQSVFASGGNFANPQGLRFNRH